MTELAKEMKEDTQAIRAMWNYLNKTSQDVKNVEFQDVTIKDEIHFYEFVKDICDMLIKAAKEDNNE